MIRAARYRLLAYVTAVLAIVLVATGALVYGLLTRQLDEAVDDQLRALTLRGAPGLGALAAQGADEGALPSGAFVVRGLGSRAQSRSASTPAGLPDTAALTAARESGSDLRTVEVEGVPYRLLTSVITVGRGGPGGPGGQRQGNGQAGAGVDGGFYQQVGLSLVERERQQWVIRLALAGGGGLGIALTALGAFFLTGRALEPVAASMARQRRFVSDASHELRTPLTLLRLEIEGDTALTPERRRPLLREVNRLGRMVGDLLLLARLDEGELPLEREPVPVADLLRTAAEEARRMAPEARVALEAGPELWVHGDADRLHQALLVLVDNAARVTPPGEAIALRARLDGSAVEIEVTDGGPGVPLEHATQIFERFFRADKARARAQGGAGLGLSIARDILRAHGGELRLENAGEAHATFVLRLPVLDLATSAALTPAVE